MIPFESWAGMNHEKPSSEDLSDLPLHPVNPPALSRTNVPRSHIVMPPKWALGYHEAYAEQPGYERLADRIQRFQDTDTPLASIEIDPGPGARSSETSRADDLIEDLRKVGVRIVTPPPTGENPIRQQAAVVENPTETIDSTSRPFLFTPTADAEIPPNAAIGIPTSLNSRADLRQLVSKCLEVSARGFPLCGPEFQQIEEADRELAVRGLQLAAFFPLLRLRLGSLPRQSRSLWPFPEQLTHIWRKFLGFRYKLSPYLYTTFDIYRQTGTPPLRPTTSADTHRSSSEENDDRFMLGPSLLVTPGNADASPLHSTRLPEGRWFHFWTNEQYAGDQTVSVSSSSPRIPVFARGGSVIPLHPIRQRLNNYPPKTLVLRTFPYGSRSNTVYHDDGITYQYENGDFHRLAVRTRQQNQRLTLHLTHEGDRNVPYEHFEWQVPVNAADSATVENRELPVFSIPEQFTRADEGLFRGHYLLRIRTPVTARSVEISLDSNEPDHARTS